MEFAYSFSGRDKVTVSEQLERELERELTH